MDNFITQWLFIGVYSNQLSTKNMIFFFNNSFVAIIWLEDNSIDDIQKQKDKLLKTWISKQIRIKFIT